MAEVVAFNIETEPNKELTNQLPEPIIKFGNTKDPVKRAVKVQEKRDEQKNRMALDPHFGKITCLSFAFEKTLSGVSAIQATTAFTADHGEAELLDWTWRQIKKAEQVITFNGTGFDIPFMMRRSALLRVPITKDFEINKHRTRLTHCVNHTDVMRLLHDTDVGEGRGSLLDIPRTLSFYVKQFLDDDWPYAEIDQSNLGDLVHNGKQKMVKDLCEWNTSKTLELFLCLRSFYP